MGKAPKIRTTITIDRQVVEDIAKVDNNLSGFMEDSARKELKRRKKNLGPKRDPDLKDGEI